MIYFMRCRKNIFDNKKTVGTTQPLKKHIGNMFAQIFDYYLFENNFHVCERRVSNFVACVLVQALQPFSVWPKQLLGVDVRHFDQHGCSGHI